jgi:hypothetical protein
MNKSNIFILFFISLIAFIAVSCDDDFLEKPKGGAVTVDTVFHTQNQAQYAVATMYQYSLEGYLHHVTDASNNCARPDILTDQCLLTENTVWICQRFNPSGAYYKGSSTPAANWDILSFGSHYKGIRRANLVLKNIDNVTDATPEWIADVKGQALFCRAWKHFELFRLYGGIPIVKEVLGDGEIKLPRNTVEEVVNAIVDWCDEAAELLPPTRPITEYARVTRLAALALKSRTLLYAASPLYNTPPSMAGEVAGARFNDERDAYLCYPTYDKERWKLAVDAAEAVLLHAPEAEVMLYDTDNPLTTGDTYTTLGDYEYVWNWWGNPEMILENTTLMGPNSNAWTWIRYGLSKINKATQNEFWGIMNHVPIEFATLYEKRDGSKWTVNITDKGDDFPVYIEGLDLDPRFYQTIVYDGRMYSSSFGRVENYNAGDGFAAGKLNVADQNPYGYALDVYKYCARVENSAANHFMWPIFRLAEFYLNYAEALNEYSGPSAEAYTALNVIRDRAGMPDKSGLSQDEFRTAVLNERAVEFAYENLRYNDLMRTLTAYKTLNREFHGFNTTAKKGLDGGLLRSWEIKSLMTRIFPRNYYYVPFPNAEISKNYLGGGGAWTGQNPGW